MKNKVMMAAAVIAAMCGAARASGPALEALCGAVPEQVIIKEMPAPGLPARAELLEAGEYANDEGCRVSVERRLKGSFIYVQDAGGRQATLGVLNDFSSGDIFSFCSPANTELRDGFLTFLCDEQHNGGLPTRGAAVVELREGLSYVSVRGEVKKGSGWKDDTYIICGGLKPVARTKSAAAGTEVFYGGAHRVWDADSRRKAEVELEQYVSVLEKGGVKAVSGEIAEVDGYLMARVFYAGAQRLFRSTGSALTVAGAAAKMNAELAGLRGRGAFIISSEAYKGRDEWGSGGAYEIEYFL